MHVSAAGKPLVDYPDDDEDEDAMDSRVERPLEEQFVLAESGVEFSPDTTTPVTIVSSRSPTPSGQTPPERLSEKRRREDEDDDELAKLTSGPKRRSSSASSAGGVTFKKKNSMTVSTTGKAKEPLSTTESTLNASAPKKIAINLGSSIVKPIVDIQPPVDGSIEEEPPENTRDGR